MSSFSRPLRAVLFDAGYTLIFPDSRRITRIFEEVGGVPADAGRFDRSERAARLALLEALGETGRGQEGSAWGSFFGELIGSYGFEPDRLEAVGEALRSEHRRRHLWSEVRPGISEALESLRGDGYRLGVVSNAAGDMEELLDRAGVLTHFEFVVDSGSFGVEKPDPSIFLEAVDRMRVDASECLYVGDLYHVDVIGARGVGMRAVLLDPWDDLEHPVDRLRSVAELPAYVNGALRHDP